MKKASLIIAGLAVATLAINAAEPFKTLITRAEKQYNSADYAGAEVTYKTLIKDYPKRQRGLMFYNLALTQTMQGKDSLAVANLDSALVYEPKKPRIIEERARIRYDNGDMDGAFNDFAQVVALDDSATISLFMLGNIAMNRNDTVTARKSFERLSVLVPDDISTHQAMAALNTKTKNYQAAIAEYDFLIANKPEAQHYISRAANLLMLDKDDAAAADIAKALELDPNDGEAYYMRAALAKKRYNLKQAKADAQKAIQLGVSPAKTKALLGALPD